MADCPTIIVVAYSARALASSAQHAGFSPLSIDVFGDDDTREMSLASVKLDGGLSDGLMLDKVIGAVEMLISAHDPIGLVYGAGFEHQPETIAAIARRTRVFGNRCGNAETRQGSARARANLRGVRRAASSDCFCAAGRTRTLAHEEAGRRRRRPHRGGSRPERWLHRTVIINVALPEGASRRCSSRAKKRSKSLASACSGQRQRRRRRFDMAALPDPSTSTPRKQRKSLAPSPRSLRNSILSASTALIFSISADAVSLIEINPRPGATLDVFESSEGALFAHHVAACEGRLTRPSAGLAFKAAEIVYAPCDLVAHAGWNWPDWVVDRPSPGTRFAAGDPFCTTLASGATVDLARICASERAQEIIALVQEAAH